MALGIGLEFPASFAWFVHLGAPSDGAIFYAMAHDTHFGVTTLSRLLSSADMAYRYQRPLYPALARLLSLNQPGWSAFGLVVVNVIAAAIGTEMLARWARRYKRSLLWGLAFPASLGVLTAFFFDLSEALLWTLLLAAFVSHEARRMELAGVALALAVLTKETAMIAVVAFCVGWIVNGQRGLSKELAWLVVLPAGAFVGVEVALWITFGEPGLMGSSGQLTVVPFLGAYTSPASVPPKHLIEDVYLTLTVVVPAITGAVWSLSLLRQKYSALALTLFFNCLQVALMTSWSWTGLVHYGRLSMGVPLLMLLVALQRGMRKTSMLLALQTIASIVGIAFVAGTPT